MSFGRRAGSLLVVAAALAAGACGASSEAGPGQTGQVRLNVFAAASLSRVFPDVAREFAQTRPGVNVAFSFAGTDALVAQIEHGAPADIFAGASAAYGDQLFAEHLVGRPAPLCTNRLVVVLPPSNPGGIHSLRDLARPGVKLVIGAETVPVGTYTRRVLQNLDALYGGAYASAALANVVSNEDNVEGVLTKVRLGEADAGFVYVTDARNAGQEVSVLTLPSEAQAVATYPIAVVTSTHHDALAAAFVDFVLEAEGQQILARAGFGPPSAAIP
jgi:molybdate transport system substrate-binding protein